MGDEVEYDALGPITAYRGWTQNNGRLESITVGKPWVPGAAAAHEWIGPPTPLKLMLQTPHPAPHPHCTCGYYALKEPESLGGMLGAVNATVLGEVELWGKVIEHEFGYRAQYARVTRLYVVYKPGICTWIPTVSVVKNYGAEVVDDEEDPVLARILKMLTDPYQGMVFLTNALFGATTYTTTTANTTTTSNDYTTSNNYTVKWEVR